MTGAAPQSWCASPLERESLAAAPTCTSPPGRRAVDHLRVLPVDRAVARVERQDGDAEEGQLASPWSVETAAQMLSALTNSDFAESLLFDGGWSPSALADRFAELLVRTFVSTR